MVKVKGLCSKLAGTGRYDRAFPSPHNRAVQVYQQGQRVTLGDAESGRSEGVPVVCRFEVRRPDGTRTERDWEKKTFAVRADRAGIWNWRMYIREGLETRVVNGQFTVVTEQVPASGRREGLLSVVRGWFART